MYVLKKLCCGHFSFLCGKRFGVKLIDCYYPKDKELLELKN